MTRRRGEHAVSGKLPITVSHPDKIFWPKEGYTKLDLIEYYDAIFPKLAPYVEDRILTLERCPDGMQGECFFQKQIQPGLRRRARDGQPCQGAPDHIIRRLAGSRTG